jgi:hypothetical protein
MNWNNPNIWLFLIFIILPALQWVAQRIKEKREVAKAAERIRRQKEETLRTGRPPAEEQAVASERAQTKTSLDAAQREAIQRRQQQLRELRQKQMQAQAEARSRARQSSGTSSRRPAQARPQAPTPSPRAPSARPTPIPAPERRPQPVSAQPRPQPKPAPAPVRVSEFEQITRQRQIEIAKRQALLDEAAREADRRGESAVRPMLASRSPEHDVTAVDATQATTSGAELLSNLDADDWRRGIIMAEILGKPVCERDGQRLF